MIRALYRFARRRLFRSRIAPMQRGSLFARLMAEHIRRIS